MTVHSPRFILEQLSRLEGVSLREAASILGVNPITVFRWRHRYGGHGVIIRKPNCYRIDLHTGCHEWQSQRDQDGYGRKRVGKKTKGAHVVAWERVHGPVPAGMEIMHTCDNPPCCNVEHLKVGTSADNSADMVRKGRSIPQSGELDHFAKLTNKIVRQIVASKGSCSQRELGQRYGVSQGHISSILTGVTWSSVTGIPRKTRKRR